jgi:hypothetical protein
LRRQGLRTAGRKAPALLGAIAAAAAAAARLHTFKRWADERA